MLLTFLSVGDYLKKALVILLEGNNLEKKYLVYKK